jgi:hypothetical protein
VKHAISPAGAAAFFSLAFLGCARHHVAQVTPAMLASVHADLRVVNGETTYVTRGTGYELVGRTKADLALMQPTLDRDATVMRRAFGDSIAPVAVTVRRVAADGGPFVLAAPVPRTTSVPVVEVTIVDPNARRDDAAAARRPSPETLAGGPGLPVVRAWLSARATALTTKTATSTQATGESDDARVPGWAEVAVAWLASDSTADRAIAMLAEHPDVIYPLSSFLTMPRPESPTAMDRRDGGRGEGGTRGGRGGAGGGMGGAMGGRGGIGGRGGMSRGGGTYGRGGSERESPELRGAALYTAQAAAFGRYLTARGGYPLIGALADGQIRGEPLDAVLTARISMTLAQMETDWFSWIVAHQKK